jgi:hypothetical protein
MIKCLWLCLSSHHASSSISINTDKYRSPLCFVHSGVVSRKQPQHYGYSQQPLQQYGQVLFLLHIHTHTHKRTLYSLFLALIFFPCAAAVLRAGVLASIEEDNASVASLLLHSGIIALPEEFSVSECILVSTPIKPTTG